ncbi:hypothetical protein CTI12_AA374670 [Artemisia annua]|uniref:DUF674 family protein n=1 Tax=Artemisia annua TaxID=35608 RepID=A0A2U1MIS1_ARTAN|nr:hypothetical protein CTI12_AA374670 [Artemisia annua]
MAASTTANDKDKISLKLMVNTEENRVIFAEADSTLVDTLFSFMTLPLGTIVRLLEKVSDEKVKTLGSLNNLYHSLVDFPDKYMSSEESKFLMLNPRSSSYDYCQKLKLNIDDTEPGKYFVCENSDCYRRSGALYSFCCSAKCRYCGKLMNQQIKFMGSTIRKGSGFVSDEMTFVVTDDLNVFPNTLGLSIRKRCDFGTTDLSKLEQRSFDIGLEQMLTLLKAAIYCKYPLTYLVFNSSQPIRELFSPEQGNIIQHLTKNETAENSKRLTLKVNLQKSTSKFLLAEADEDFADFIFGFLEIPLGILIGKLMKGSSSLDSLDNLFASISNMSVEGCIKSQDLKDMLIKPQLAYKHVSQNQIFPLDVLNNVQLFCHSCYYYPKNKVVPYIKCSDKKDEIDENLCDNRRCDAIAFKDARAQGRYLKTSAKVMLTDDLVITPLSSISTVSVLKKLKVSLNDIEEHNISIGIEEVQL